MSKRRRDARRKLRRDSKMGEYGNMSSKQMRNAVNNIETDTIENVIEVIVKTNDEEIILSNPEVTVMNMGQEMWTVVPSKVERRPVNVDTSSPIAPEDVKINPADVTLIMSTANVSEEEAINALKKSGGDLAAAMRNLK